MRFYSSHWSMVAALGRSLPTDRLMRLAVDHCLHTLACGGWCVCRLPLTRGRRGPAVPPVRPLLSARCKAPTQQSWRVRTAQQTRLTFRSRYGSSYPTSFDLDWLWCKGLRRLCKTCNQQWICHCSRLFPCSPSPARLHFGLIVSSSSTSCFYRLQHFAHPQVAGWSTPLPFSHRLAADPLPCLRAC